LRRDLSSIGKLFLLLALLFVPVAASAQENYNYSVGLLGGLGGSVDAEPGDNLTNTGYQLNLAMVTEPQTHLGIRVGKLKLDEDEVFNSLTGADLSYVTVGGEYRFRESFYESGIYLGLGGYRVQGTDFALQDQSETAVGLVIGVTGEFEINRWLGFLVELSGHYANLEDSQLFAMGHAGLTFHF
jgi:hypothetical protein